MIFTSKQILCFISVLLLQTTMLFASPDEANTSAVQSASETDYTIGKLIEKLTDGGPELSGKRSIAERPIDPKIANSITKLASNSVRVEVPQSWIRHPLIVQEGWRGSAYFNMEVDIPMIKDEPWYTPDILSKIQYAKVLPGTPMVILVDPASGNWVYGILCSTDKKRPDSVIPSGNVRISKSVIFIPVAYFVHDSRQSKTRWQMRERRFDGVSEQKVMAAPLDVWIAYRSIDKSSLAPFGLKIRYFVSSEEPDSEDEQETTADYSQHYWEDEAINTKPYKTLIEATLKEGGVVGGVFFEHKRDLRVFANPVPQKLPPEFLLPEHLFSSRGLEKVPGFFGYEGSFPFEPKERWIRGWKARTHKYSTQLLVPSPAGMKFYQLTRYKVDQRTNSSPLEAGLIDCGKASKV